MWMKTIIEIDWSSSPRKKKAVQEFIDQRFDGLFFDLTMEGLLVTASSSVTHGEKCGECAQPMLPKGQKRERPDDYRHAYGCPKASKAERKYAEAWHDR